jgi:hypothetical protein
MTSSVQPNSNHRGRPTLSKMERKRARNLSVSDEAWKQLEEQIQNLPVKTASELVEKIGLGQIQLTPIQSSPLGDIPICRRLKALVENPIAVFSSILAFVRRTSEQLNLPTSDARIYDVTLRASTIVFYSGYTHPDVLINNPSALIKWLCYEILQAEAALLRRCRKGRHASPPVSPNAPTHTLEAPSETERIFQKINHALNRLEVAARSPEYKALKMKTIDGLTIKQISRIFKLQKHEVSKVEVSRMIKQGLVNFRELFYDAPENPIPLDIPDKAPKKWVQETAHRYLQLALQETLTNQDQERLQEILLATSSDPYLDFWLNEIDYCLRDRLCHYRQDCPTEPKKGKAIELDAPIREQLATHMEDHLYQKKKEIDRELAFCQTAQQIREVLAQYTSKEAGTQIPIKRLISP